jgi:hypothetical protein
MGAVAREPNGEQAKLSLLNVQFAGSVGEQV